MKGAFLAMPDLTAAMKDWVDECCSELDAQIVRISAADFKRLALRPAAAAAAAASAAAAAPTRRQSVMAECSPTAPPGQRRGSYPSSNDDAGQFARYAPLVQRSSERCASPAHIAAPIGPG